MGRGGAERTVVTQQSGQAVSGGGGEGAEQRGKGLRGERKKG